MREAIEEYIEREEKREQFRQDALAAWSHYQTTGLHATAEKRTPGWPSSKQARTPLLPNATTEMVATCFAGCSPSACVLSSQSRDAAKRAVKAIRQGVKTLGKHPEVGRPVEELPVEFREWVMNSGVGRMSLCIATTGNRS